MAGAHASVSCSTCRAGSCAQPCGRPRGGGGAPWVGGRLRRAGRPREREGGGRAHGGGGGGATGGGGHEPRLGERGGPPGGGGRGGPRPRAPAPAPAEPVSEPAEE